MSLAEELLADLEDAEQEDLDREVMENNMELEEVGDMALSDQYLDGFSQVDKQVENSVRSIAKLRDSKKLSNVLQDIKSSINDPKPLVVEGPIEAAPEYQLIVEANNLTVEIDNETNIIHKYVRDLYQKRFPELESLVPTTMEYIRTAKILGNDILDRSKNNAELQTVLTPATLMVVSVTASTTQGEPLTDDELNRVIEACQMAVELQEYRAQILTFVESKMSFIAPNLSTIVGTSVAAKLMGHAGGLTSLCKMPGCNILLLGSQKKTLTGFSSVANLPHTGYIFHCDVVQRLPPDLRRKAAKLIASKATLAARVDSFHTDTEGSIGESLLAEIEKKYDKWLEPPPVKQIKALPTPIDPPAKKRGGRRYRKMKERLGITELRKAYNRVHFGSINEDAYSDVGVTLGAAGKNSESGRVRIHLADAKTKARVSKAVQMKLQKQNRQAQTYGGSTTVKKHVSGTASSIAFTPLQGLEIVNPQAAEKKVDEGNKYFSQTAAFMKSENKSISQNGSAYSQ